MRTLPRRLSRSAFVRAQCAQYDAYVRTHDRDLIAFFDTTPRISDEDRAAGRAAVVAAVRRVHARQGLRTVTWRIAPSLTTAAVFAAPYVYPVGAWLAQTATRLAHVDGRWHLPGPMIVFLTAWSVSALAYMMWVTLLIFGATPLRGHTVTVPEAMERPVRARQYGYVFGIVALDLMMFEPTGLAVARAVGELAIAIPETFGWALALGLTVAGLRLNRVRAAAYLLLMGLLAALASIPQADVRGWLHCPGWVADGLCAGVHGSAVLAGVLGILLVGSYVASVHERLTQRHNVVDELVQTLLWLVMRIDEPEAEVSRQFGRPTPRNLVWYLERVALMIEHWIPLTLHCDDRAGRRAVQERCRGVAVSVRTLRTRMLLHQHGSLEILASSLCRAVVPIALGNWTDLAYTSVGNLPEPLPRRVRALRWAARLAAALLPLGVVVTLHLINEREEIIKSLIPVAGTWLLVSVVSWLDPGAGDRYTSASNLVTAVPLVKGKA